MSVPAQAAALHAHQAGATQEQLAHAFSVTRQTIADVIKQYGDTRALSKQYLNAHALTFSEAAVKHADDNHLEMLDRLDVAAKRQQQTGATGISIIIGTAQSPLGPDPVLSAIPINRLQSAGEETAQVTERPLSDTDPTP